MTFGMTLGDPSGEVRFIVGGVAFIDPFDKIDASLKDPCWQFLNWFISKKYFELKLICNENVTTCSSQVKHKIFQTFS